MLGIKDLSAGFDTFIVSRFDQLNNSEQVILKTAAVIGLKFSANELKQILQELGHEACLNQFKFGLMVLVENNFISLEITQGKII
jgi:predicted ATPase